MNRLNLGCTVLLVMVVFASFGQADTSLLTFESALQLMNDNNPAIKRIQEEIKQKEYEMKMKRGLYMPKVAVSAKAVAMSDRLHLDLTDIRDAITPIYDVLGNYGVFADVPYVVDATTGTTVILDQDQSTAAVRQQLLAAEEKVANGDWDPTIQEKNFAFVSADLVWPVFTGGKISSANKAAKIEVEMSEQEARKVAGELLNELVTRYYGLALAIQAEKVMEEKNTAMQHHFEDTKKMFDEGMVAKIEVLHAQVAASDAEREYKNAQRMVETIQAGLNATLAKEEKEFILPSNQLFINKEIPGLSYWIDNTWENNPQLKQIEGKKQLADIKTNVSKGDYLPTVALIGTCNLVDYDLSPYVPDWMVGAGLTWTVFEGMSRQKQYKADKTLGVQVQAAEEKAHHDLTAYLTKLYNELETELLQINELDHTLELAQEYAESTQKAYKQGFANSTNVVEAQSKLAQVKALRLKSFYEYDVTLSSLLQVSGRPEDFMQYCTGENTIIESIQ